MNGSGLGAAATARLTAAGWFPGRAVPVEPLLEPLLEEDYEIPPVLRAFLRGYGGLEFDYPNPHCPEHRDTCGIDPQLAVDALFRTRVSLWEERVGAQLVPFGEASRLFLVMAADGRVWGGFDEFLFELGDSPEDALDGLCEGHDRPTVPAVPEESEHGQA
ncbi:SUKH-3 domain-containing protein [Actinospica robiniae]|uniref:SUKH-3 domain-containing protein n=1 Tax=Actinospica robiniae TaxID=304901 RepID=UPI00041F06B4|nr:SUKH-3 domain-containing protein [Actinospica robiniae]